ncbi:hypothetical protein AB6A40_007974 [Gnathostoma spinigerum]|uniref:Akirin n=1 Tax=Gnathostoma spinigerum TaxID=75299 RepID=A0ABD6EP13_9BILA
MACGLALKRPHEYDTYLSADGGGEAKRARQTNAHCSPFRAQIGTIAASLPATSNGSTSFPFSELQDEQESSSPFSSVAGRTQLSSGQLQSYLRAEVRYLKRRRLIPRRESIGSVGRNGYMSGSIDDSEVVVDGSTASSSGHYRQPPKSPNTNSGSDSDGETSSTVIKGQHSSSMNVLYEKPQFSLKQVQMICERLLKQQEIRLRYEYETLLNRRLEEQHEQYVQFAHEQIERQNRDVSELSYLS